MGAKFSKLVPARVFCFGVSLHLHLCMCVRLFILHVLSLSNAVVVTSNAC